jgi:hypothetical protein
MPSLDNQAMVGGADKNRNRRTDFRRVCAPLRGQRLWTLHFSQSTLATGAPSPWINLDDPLLRWCTVSDFPGLYFLMGITIGLYRELALCLAAPEIVLNGLRQRRQRAQEQVAGERKMLPKNSHV